MDGCFSVAFDFGALALSRSLLLPRLSAVSIPMLIPFPFSFSLRRGQPTLRHRFLPSTTLPPTDPPTFNPKGSPPGTLVPSTLSYADFTLRHLAWNHPTVPFDFAIRNNILPDDVKEVEKGEFEDEKARAASELKLREDKLDLKWVNQSEFVDVYTGEHKPMSRSYVKLLGDMTDPPSFLLNSQDNASTPSRRIDITPVPTHKLASILPSLTSPSAKPTGDAVIPLGEGPELWKWVLQTRPRPANFADRVQALEEAKRRLKERKEKKAAEQ